jgi:hypothetical protein
MFSRRPRPRWAKKNNIFFSWFFSKSNVQRHIRSGSYVSVGEILNSWPDYKYKDVLLSTKSGSCSDPSGRDPRTRVTDTHTDRADRSITQIFFQNKICVKNY